MYVHGHIEACGESKHEKVPFSIILEKINKVQDEVVWSGRIGIVYVCMNQLQKHPTTIKTLLYQVNHRMNEGEKERKNRKRGRELLQFPLYYITSNQTKPNEPSK